MGIVTASLNICTALVIRFKENLRVARVCKGLASLSFLSLLTALIVITFVQFKAVDLVNTYGNGIGVYAYRGDRYMVSTWVAVTFMLLGASAGLFGEIIGSWNLPRVWSSVCQSGYGMEYVKST